MSDLINYKLIEESKLTCIQNWCDLFGKNTKISSYANRRLTSEKEPLTRIINRLDILNYNILRLIWFNEYIIYIFRLKSYDDPVQSPTCMLRLSDVQTIPSNVLYHKGHLLNIIQLNIKQVVEFIK